MTETKLRPRIGRWIAAALCALPAAQHAATAQGFGLNEIGSCAIGRGFATTAAPCEDASSLYWNPGATSAVPRGLALYAGAAGIQLKGSFTRDVTGRRYDADVPVEFPPFFGLTWRGGTDAAPGRLALGVAAYVPYGLTSQWGEDFIGRFAAQKASLQTIYVQPTLSFDLVPGRLSVGAGAIVGHSSIELRQALDFSTLPVPGQLAGTTFAALGFAEGTEFGRAQIEGGSKLAYGAHVGAQLRLTPAVRIGARYLTAVKFRYEEGEATFTPSPLAASYVLPPGNAIDPRTSLTLADLTAPQFAAGGLLAPGQTVSSEIEHPAQFQIGIAYTYTGSGNTTIEGDYARVFWSSFDELEINFQPLAAGVPSPLSSVLREEYEDVDSYRVGVEHRYASGLAARAGFHYAGRAAPDQSVTPLLPDMDRYEFGAGVGIPLGGRLLIDAAYLRVETEGRRGRTAERPAELSAQETVARLNSGWYALNANVFSLSLKARF